jgi:hypothetical protein
MRLLSSGPVLGVALLLLPLPGAAQEVGPLAAHIKAVGKEGRGSEEAARAWKELTRRGPDALVAILAEMDGCSPVPANYLRAAVDAIAERTLAAGKPLPADRLEAFLRDRRHDGAPRRLAYDWLVRVDATAPKRLLPGMLDDPGAELRRDAVDVVLKEAQEQLDRKDRKSATRTFQKALAAARDLEQVKLIAKQLKDLGVPVDLTKQLGFVTHWSVIGPFDNSGGAGYFKTFPPERGVDLAAAYAGKGGKEVRWQRLVAAEPLATVDLNRALGKLKGVTGYAFAAVVSPTERPVEIRAASNNAVRIYLNGKQVFGREEYHHGMALDQHVGRGVLKAGRNEILVKVCQNEQTDSWAELWSFQLRVCDALGGRVPLTADDVRPAAGGQE